MLSSHQTTKKKPFSGNILPLASGILVEASKKLFHLYKIQKKSFVQFFVEKIENIVDLLII